MQHSSSQEVDRITVLVFAEMLSKLTAHALGQRRRHRRRQPAWWNADCFAACVARNGAFRDHRVRSEESYTRFSAVRQQFHRAIRAARRNFWELWEDHVSFLSTHNPRVAPSTIRRTSQCNTDSSQVERVQWSDLPDPPSGHDSVAHWREHFMSVGARSDGSFDETFFEELMGRFSQLRSSQEVGSFGGPFSPSELRRALGVCVVILQWALMECRTPCSKSRSLGGSAPCSICSISSCLGAWFPLCGNGALWCPSSNGETPVSPPTVAHLSCVVLLETLRASGPFPHGTTYLFPT